MLGEIPEAMQDVTEANPVSRTPVALAEGNPLANHPWRDDPDARLPEQVDTLVIGAGFTGGGVFSGVGAGAGARVGSATGGSDAAGGFCAPSLPLESELPEPGPKATTRTTTLATTMAAIKYFHMPAETTRRLAYWRGRDLPVRSERTRTRSGSRCGSPECS